VFQKNKEIREKRMINQEDIKSAQMKKDLKGGGAKKRTFKDKSIRRLNAANGKKGS